MAYNKYEVHRIHLDAQENVVSESVTNHESGLISVGSNDVNATLEHLEDDPAKPNTMILRLTFSDLA